MKKVSIILLNYNGKAFNKNCIDSLFLQSYDNFEIVFVDNNSHDGSLEDVEKLFNNEIISKKIIIVKNDKNTGFTGGNNLGVKYVDPKSEYICLLNNDTILPQNWLEELVKGIESDSKLGAVGSLVLDRGMEDKYKDLFFVQHKMGINNYLFETSFKNLSKQEIQSGIFYTTGIGGCCFLYKKNIIQTPFADYYFAYAEDTYLSMRIVLAGYKLALCSKSVVDHLGSASFGKKPSLFKAFHGIKNHFSNFLIFHSLINIIFLFPIFFLYQILKMFMGGFSIRFRGFIKAMGWLIKNRKEIKEQRKLVRLDQKISYKQFLSQLSTVIFENIYFVKLPNFAYKIMDAINWIFNKYFIILGISRGQGK